MTDPLGLSDARDLLIDQVEKTYPGSGRVLGPLSFSIPSGQIVGLCGENGAGKSTLLRLLAGLEAPSAGRIVGNDSVGMVHQHFSLVGSLTVAENIWLGREPARLGLWQGKKAAAQTRVLAEELKFTLDPEAVTQTLPVGIEQRVEILKALREPRTVVLFDEPTAVLAPFEIAGLLALIRSLKASGRTVLLVSHKLGEVTEVCERFLVLRHGQLVLDSTDSSAADIAQAMLAGPLGQATPHERSVPLPAVRGPSTAGSTPSIFQSSGPEGDLAVASGQIVGIAGVEGNGQSELFARWVGAHRKDDRGTLILGGQRPRTPAEKRALGLRFVPAQRHRDALLTGASVYDNLRLSQPRMPRSEALRRLTSFDVRPANLFANVDSLSGGNQQKLVFARELDDSARFVVVYEPTRGVDLHAKAMLWQALKQKAKDGAAIVVISSDLDELRELATVIYVLFRARLSSPFPVAIATDTALGAAMAGLSS